jgi:hypothetical protein
MKTTHKTCQNQEIEQVLNTCHPSYTSVLSQSNLMDEVKELVNEKAQFLKGFSRELVIYEAVIKVISRHGQLEPSIWFG